MKKEYKILIILSFILLIITATLILSLGKTYTLNLGTYDKNNKLNIENKDGQIDVLEEKRVGDNYLVKIKGKKPGKVFINYQNEELGTNKIIYIHKSMIITEESYFGKCTGSEIIPISISIILLYILYVIIKKYKEASKENLYQYKNIFYLSIIIYLFFFLIRNIINIFEYKGITDTLSKTITSVSSISFILLPIAIITFILVSLSNIQLIRKEGKSLRNLLGVFLGIFCCFLPLIPDKVYTLLMKSQIFNIYNLNSPGPYIYDFIEAIIYLTVSYLECLIIGTTIIAIKSVRKKVKYDKDYIIILGCQIRKDGTLTPLLKGRVDRALEFRNEQLKNTNKDLTFICSGGKGSDEIISEGESMKNYLLEQGINKKNILVDDKSTNTYENIKFSYSLIKKKKTNVAFSTTNYHVLRAGLIATEQGLILEGIGSKTKAYFWINAFIREFIGTIYAEKKKHIIIFIIISLILIMILGIQYLSNIL